MTEIVVSHKSQLSFNTFSLLIILITTRWARWHTSSTLPPPVGRFESLSENSRGLAFAIAGFLGGGVFIYSIVNPNKIKMNRMKAMVGLEPGGVGLEVRKLSTREKRFLKFSSVDWDGQI